MRPLVSTSADDLVVPSAETQDAFLASLSERPVPVEVLRLVPPEFALEHGVLPLAREGNVLRVAISDPGNIDGPDRLAYLLQLEIEPVLVDPAEFAQALERLYGVRETPAERLTRALASRVEESPEHESIAVPNADADGDAPVIRLVQSLIEAAARRGASDIHFEPLARRFRVRHRIDGVLIEAENLPKRLHPAVISRLKIMANISIAEKRVPQDGRIQIVVTNRTLDLRVSSLPTAHGESIVMRILDKEGLKIGLTELGFMADDRAAFERLVGLPDGIVLVTGPTGSGKTTTLYSCLHHLNQPSRKIITVEDPVEYQLAGINQVPVRADIGMTFGAALRAILRQAPNVVMIGEIRDRETAEIAINASLTGHLVFSTLHTNDAPGAITRLADMGAKPFLVASSLRGAMAQRLVRKICQNCGRPHEPTEREKRWLGAGSDGVAGANFRRGDGCAECHGTGYRGRMGIFEILPVDDEVRSLIHQNATASQLRACARSRGMRTMREDGLRKASAGLTTLEEVVSITVNDAS